MDSCGVAAYDRTIPRAGQPRPTCPIAKTSPYVPRAGLTPPIPEWKRFDDFRDVLPRHDAARIAAGDDNESR